jgi:hypothetical protein
MRPRPKIYPIPLVSVASLLLALCALVFSLAYGRAYLTDSSKLGLAYWWGGAFALVALLDCAMDKFMSPKGKYYTILAYFLSACQFFFLLFAFTGYYSNYTDTEGAYFAPRIAATILLAGIWVAEAAVKFLKISKPAPYFTPSLQENVLLLLLGMGEAVLALFVWSRDASALAGAYTTDRILDIVAAIVAFASMAFAIYNLSRTARMEEEKLCQSAMVLFFGGFVVSLIVLFVSLADWNNSAMDSTIFYWNLFAMAGFAFCGLSGGGYFMYVYYRLRN